MRLELHVFHHFPNSHDDKPPSWVVALKTQMGRIEDTMSRVEEKLEELKPILEQIGAGVVGVQGDVAALSQEIATLKAQIGSLSPEQEAAFDALIAKSREAADKLTALDALNPTTES